MVSSTNVMLQQQESSDKQKLSSAKSERDDAVKKVCWYRTAGNKDYVNISLIYHYCQLHWYEILLITAICRWYQTEGNKESVLPTLATCTCAGGGSNVASH